MTDVVRTKQLAATLHAQSVASEVIYTCPAGRTAILKDITVWCYTAATVTIKVRPGAGAGGFPIDVAAIGANGVRVISRFIVLEPGFTLEVDATGAANDLQVYVSGVELDGVAP